MARLESLATGLTLLVFACLPVTYAIRTLIRMKPKALYPLLRIRAQRWLLHACDDVTQ